jgi:hypothetical protein
MGAVEHAAPGARATGSADFQPAHDPALCAGAGWKPALPIIPPVPVPDPTVAAGAPP